MAFTQNYWAEYLLSQFLPDIDSLLPATEFGLINGAINQNFKKDQRIANQAWIQMLYYGNSLLLSFINGLYYQTKTKTILPEDYPAGLPRATFYDNVFTMRDLFIGMFDGDEYEPIIKREHVLSSGATQSSLNRERREYDSYLANIDMEIGRIISKLKDQGVLDRTYFILTADHGEMFERGTVGHTTPMLYDPVMRILLMVFVPGNELRRDFFSPSSNVDLLPTILNLAGIEIPASCEGKMLPGFGGVEDKSRSIIAMEAKESSAFKPFTKATYSIIKGNYKLIYYHGYVHKYQDHFEFYDLSEDPEEMFDKYSKEKFAPAISEMKAELFNAMDRANKEIN